MPPCPSYTHTSPPCSVSLLCRCHQVQPTRPLPLPVSFPFLTHPHPVLFHALRCRCRCHQGRSTCHKLHPTPRQACTTALAAPLPPTPSLRHTAVNRSTPRVLGEEGQWQRTDVHRLEHTLARRTTEQQPCREPCNWRQGTFGGFSGARSTPGQLLFHAVRVLPGAQHMPPVRGIKRWRPLCPLRPAVRYRGQPQYTGAGGGGPMAASGHPPPGAFTGQAHY